MCQPLRWIPIHGFAGCYVIYKYEINLIAMPYILIPLYHLICWKHVRFYYCNFHVRVFSIPAIASVVTATDALGKILVDVIWTVAEISTRLVVRDWETLSSSLLPVKKVCIYRMIYMSNFPIGHQTFQCIATMCLNLAKTNGYEFPIPSSFDWSDV